MLNEVYVFLSLSPFSPPQTGIDSEKIPIPLNNNSLPRPDCK